MVRQIYFHKLSGTTNSKLWFIETNVKHFSTYVKLTGYEYLCILVSKIIPYCYTEDDTPALN